MPVRELAGDPGNHINQGIRVRCVLPENRQFGKLRHDGGVGVIQFFRIPVFPGFPIDFLFTPFFAGNEFFVKPVQPGSVHNAEPGGGEPLLHGNRVAGVYVAAAGAALDGVAGSLAVQRQFRAFLQRQNTVVFKQDHAFRSSLPGNGADAAFAIGYAEIDLSGIFLHAGVPPSS